MQHGTADARQQPRREAAARQRSALSVPQQNSKAKVSALQVRRLFLYFMPGLISGDGERRALRSQRGGGGGARGRAAIPTYCSM